MNVTTSIASKISARSLDGSAVIVHITISERRSANSWHVCSNNSFHLSQELAGVICLVCLSGQVLQLGQTLREHGLLVLGAIGVHQRFELVELVFHEDGLFITFHPAEGCLFLDDDGA